MATKRQPVPTYLDEEEYIKLKAIARKWKCSLSAAIKRLILECEMNE
jgi:hypothetical protein